jgi:hypothetical protein
MRKALPWLLALVASLALAGTPLAPRLNIWAAGVFARLAGHSAPYWTIVWPLGDIVVTTLGFAVLLFARRRPTRERLTGGGLFALGLLIEVVCKHWALGNASSTLAHLRRPDPPAPIVTAVTHAVSRAFARLQIPDQPRKALSGTFPSGHVWRLTFIAGWAVRRPGWLLPALVATLAAFAVVVRVGHALTDALGGAFLAMFLLAWGGRLGR